MGHEVTPMTGAELRRRRIALGLSRKRLAKLFGCHTSTVSRMESSARLERGGMADLAMKWIEMFWEEAAE
jgi:transcriptional regulator with XRE-family HTH domain